MKFVSLGICIFLCSFHALATLEIYQSPQVEEYDVLTPEEGLWFLDHYQMPAGQLPEKISHQAFADRASALQALKSRSPFSVWIKGFTPRNLTEVRGQNLWTVENQWSWDWEIRYADWVEKNIHKNFFKDHDIKVDCADVAVAARWIFARIYKLPAANRMAGGSVLFTQDTMKTAWAQLPINPDWSLDPRFLKALDYLLENSYTHSLMEDSYPIALNVNSILAGVHHLHLRTESGHTNFMHRVSAHNNSQAPLSMIYSTVPREARVLWESPFYLEQLQPEQGGLLRMRWPQKTAQGWGLVGATAMPHYSLEQYSSSLLQPGESFASYIFKQINPQFDPMVLVKDISQQLQSSVADRVTVVEEGYQYCQSHDCSPGTAGYEDWSTPSRDQKILDLYEFLESFTITMSMESPDVMTAFTEEMAKVILSYEGYDFTTFELIEHWQRKFYDSDPRMKPERRWNLLPADFLDSRKDFIVTTVQQRSDKIQSNSCLTSSCPTDSSLYEKFQTYTEDQAIQNQIRSFSQYCQNFSGSLCSDLKALVAQASFTWRNQKVSFDQLVRQSMLLNADPRSPDRWGDQVPGILVRGFGASLDIQENSEYRTYPSDNKTVVLDRTSFQILSRFQALPAMAADPDGLIWQENGTLYWGRGNLKNPVSLSAPQKISKFRQITPSFFLAELEDGDLDLYQFEKTQVLKRGRFNNALKIGKSLAYCFQSQNQNQAWIYDLSQVPAKIFDVSSLIHQGLMSVAYSKGQLLAQSRVRNQYIRVDLATLKQTVVGRFDSFDSLSEKENLVLTGFSLMEASLFRLDDQLNIIQELKFDPFVELSAYPYILKKDTSKKELYKVDAGFQAQLIWQSGDKYSTFLTNHFLSQYLPDGFQLLDAETLKVVFKGKSGLSIGANGRFWNLQKSAKDKGVFEYDGSRFSTWLQTPDPSSFYFPREGQEWSYDVGETYLFIAKP